MPEEDEEGDLTVNILLIRKARAYKTDNFSFYKRFCTLKQVHGYIARRTDFGGRSSRHSPQMSHFNLPVLTKRSNSAIVPLQLAHSPLKQWRPSLLNNSLLSLKQEMFFLITSIAFEKLVTSCMLTIYVPFSTKLWCEQRDLFWYFQGLIFNKYINVLFFQWNLSRKGHGGLCKDPIKEERRGRSRGEGNRSISFILDLKDGKL